MANGFLVVWSDNFEKKSGGVGLATLQFFGYLKWQLELLIFYERFN